MQARRETRSFVHCWWQCKMVQLLENSMADSQKIKNKIIVQFNNPTSGYISKRMEKRILKRYLHTPIHSSIIHNSGEADGTQAPPWMDR